MLKLGLSTKVKFELNPAEGYPIARATDRILQGEPIEAVCAHDLTMMDGSFMFKISRVFSNCLKPNPIKLQRMNSELDEFIAAKRKQLLESGDLVTQEDIDAIANSEEVNAKLSEYHWLDYLTGFVSLYTVSDNPNADAKWNSTLNIWQVVALTEILPDQIISLPKPVDQ